MKSHGAFPKRSKGGVSVSAKVDWVHLKGGSRGVECRQGWAAWHDAQQEAAFNNRDLAARDQ
jgi:hypothetical protein